MLASNQISRIAAQSLPFAGPVKGDLTQTFAKLKFVASKHCYVIVRNGQPGARNSSLGAEERRIFRASCWTDTCMPSSSSLSSSMLQAIAIARSVVQNAVWTHVNISIKTDQIENSLILKEQSSYSIAASCQRAHSKQAEACRFVYEPRGGESRLEGGTPATCIQAVSLAIATCVKGLGDTWQSKKADMSQTPIHDPSKESTRADMYSNTIHVPRQVLELIRRNLKRDGKPQSLELSLAGVLQAFHVLHSECFRH